MKKLLTLLSVLLVCVLLAVPVFAETEAPATDAAVEDTATVPAVTTTAPAVTQKKGSGTFELTINPNKRETDISFITDGLIGAATPGAQDSAKQQTNKKIWIGVLCVLLVIAVIVLIVSLRRVPDKDKELDDKEWGIDTSEKEAEALDENRIIRPLEKPETPAEEPAPAEPEEVDDRPEDL